MWARLSDPGTYQAFQHFITHAPWDAERLWKRLRARVPGAHGRADSRRDEFSQTGPGLGRRRAAVLRRARQDRELPDGGHRRVVDGHAGVAVGRDVVSARGVADAARSGRGPRFPATVRFAPKWQLALTLLRQVRAAGFTVTAVARRCRVRRQRHAAPHVASGQAALRVGGLVRSQGVPGHARPRSAAAADGQRTPAHPPSLAARHAHRRGARVGGDADRARQWRLVSWRNGTNPPVAGPLLRRPRDARARLARHRRLAPEVWLLCERELAARRPRTATTWCDLPADRLAARAGPPRASTLGDRAAVPGTQRRDRARSLRRAQPAGVATPRRPDRASPTAFSRTNADDGGRRI